MRAKARRKRSIRRIERRRRLRGGRARELRVRAVRDDHEISDAQRVGGEVRPLQRVAPAQGDRRSLPNARERIGSVRILGHRLPARGTSVDRADQQRVAGESPGDRSGFKHRSTSSAR